MPMCDMAERKQNHSDDGSERGDCFGNGRNVVPDGKQDADLGAKVVCASGLRDRAAQRV